MDPWGLLLRLPGPKLSGERSKKNNHKIQPKCFLETQKSRLQQWILLPIKVSKFMWILWMKVTPNILQNCNKIKYFFLNSAIRLSTVFLIILYSPRFLLKSRQSSKFHPILGEMAHSKKLSFSTTTKSWAIFDKISQIGPWVSRIHWCEGHSICSTYMVVRLSDISSIY